MEGQDQYQAACMNRKGLTGFKCSKKLIEQKVRVYMSPTVQKFIISVNYSCPSGCLDLDRMLHHMCITFYDLFIQVLQELLSKNKIDPNWTSTHPLKVYHSTNKRKLFSFVILFQVLKYRIWKKDKWKTPPFFYQARLFLFFGQYLEDLFCIFSFQIIWLSF